MHIERPPGIERQIAAALESIRAGQGDMHALYTLELIPELAKEPRIKALLLELSTHRWPAMRRSAGRSLALAGFREGLQCLTRCALGTHPVLKQNQREEHDSNLRPLARQYLMPFHQQLHNDLVGLLVEDRKDPRGNFHVVVLSAVPALLSAPRLEPLLASRDERSQAAAALVLGRIGKQEARPVLEREIARKRYLEPALLALSHIPDART